MTSQQRQNRLIGGFILLSLLLHLLLLLVPRLGPLLEDSGAEPVFVELRPAQQRDRELDLPIRKELVKPRQKPAKRLAEQDQVVEKEMAPEGKDVEDRERAVRVPQPPQKTPERETQPRPRSEATVAKSAPQPKAPVTPEGWQPSPQQQNDSAVPDLQTLTQISPQALAQIETDWRRKYREDIDKGDTVWMDTEQDLLISFMRRFRNNIYSVWNYPSAAVQRQQQGTCLVRITIDRKGNVTDVNLLESSGFRTLDDEAMDAVRQGATYGPLPRAYPNEYLKIMAFFEYRLGPQYERTTRRRPGQIY